MNNYTHLDKAKEFENEFNLLETTFPNQMLGLKTTRLFYAAMHYLLALAEQKNKIIGDTHEKIKNAINPNSQTKIFDFKMHIYNAYRSLKEFSEYERYQMDKSLIVYQKQIQDNYENSKVCFTHFVSYLVNTLGLRK